MRRSRRTFLVGAGGAAAAVAALAGPAVAARGGRRVPLLLTRIADGRGADRAGLVRLRPGEAVALRLAPTDYDPRAVEVSVAGRPVGYVPRLRAEALASLLAAGYAADGVVRDTRGGSSRPEVTVEVRLLA